MTKKTINHTESIIVPDFFQHISSILDLNRLSKDDIVFQIDERPECEFFGGLVGYVGYEMKSQTLCGRFNNDRANTPASTFLFSDRVVIFDHEKKIAFVSLISDSLEMLASQKEWMQSLQATQLRETSNCIQASEFQVKMNARLSHDKGRYVKNILAASEKIEIGETYEVCLTTQLEASVSCDAPHPLQFYKHLRKSNPAPFAAFFDFGQFLVASSSPERFMEIDIEGNVSMKPIKGTIQRATKSNFSGTDIDKENSKRIEKLQNNEKDRSENLMIVDLIRNDLGLVCETGSVLVPKLMHVESFATVHQLVTTVTGKLKDGYGAIDVIKHSFPPGETF
jgi:para-aminobenzoate synthetase